MFIKRRSFSLIELTVAAVILGLGILLLGTLVINFKNLSKRTTYHYKALNLAKDPLEWYETTRFAHGGTDPAQLYFTGQTYGGDWGEPLGFVGRKIQADWNAHKDDGQFEILPREHPKTLYMWWQPYHATEVIPIICTPSDGSAPREWHFNYNDVFISWVDARGERRGMAFGLVPFRHYNQYSLTINHFKWEQEVNK